MRGCLIANTVHLVRLNPWLLELDFGNPLQISVPLTLQQATTDPHLRWRLLNTHRQVLCGLSCGVTAPIYCYGQESLRRME